MRQLVVLAVFLTIIIPSAARAESAADKFGKFLNQDVPRLSKAYAQAELEKRWFDAFSTGVAEGLAVTADIIRRFAAVSAIKVPNEMDVPTAVATLIQIDGYLADVNNGLARLQRLRVSLTNLETVCSTPQSHQTLAIRSAGLRAISQVLRPPPRYDGIYLQVYPLDSPLLPLTFLWSYYLIVADDLDKKKVEELAQKYPDKVIQPEAIENLSRQICEEERARHNPNLAALVQHIDHVLDVLSKSLARLDRAFRSAEVPLLQGALHEILARSGVLAPMVEQAQRIAASELTIQLEVAANELELLRRALTSARACSERLYAAEEYDDAIAEVTAALSVLASQPHSEDLRSRIEKLQADVARRARDNTTRPRPYTSCAAS